MDKSIPISSFLQTFDGRVIFEFGIGTGNGRIGLLYPFCVFDVSLAQRQFPLLVFDFRFVHGILSLFVSQGLYDKHISAGSCAQKRE